ncbi:bile-acid 7-alpha-dehydratase [Gordonia spumicola]|uniref:Bile-acid 7-alpha-dehydratase n=1 Tax=Gordonia spumicola TaxID=589161 RepID=A0A7I9VAB5_9ACTN|nr:nuclear transport factor 2 family protein [Gordonia spumicola]GEE02269.1 bile-acid 7-alpha-dehydratase [Gordonia spumicola]
MDTTSAQIATLTAISDITALKHDYWRACDEKDVDGFRDSFIASGAVIDYGPLGSFDDAAPMVAIFERVALAKVDGRYAVLDMHTGGHPHITVTGPDTARGRWSLRFRQIDTVGRTETVSTGVYDDEYLREDGVWRMSVCRFTQHWSVRRPLGDDAVVTEGAFPAAGSDR